MIFRIALRNIVRNGRRSFATVSAIAVGTMALLLFAAFQNQTMLGLQTNVVQANGHLSLFKAGYSDFGAANPAAYDIEGYEALIARLRDDPVLRDKIRVLTPTVALSGIASNPGEDSAKTFVGQGSVPSDRARMRQWNEFGLAGDAPPPSPLRDGAPDTGVIGGGLARMLGLCAALTPDDCPAQKSTPAKAEPGDARDFSALVANDPDLRATGGSGPQLDLLASSAGGTPNIVKMKVAEAGRIGIKELDDSYVGMHIGLAQRLLYGNGEPRVTSIVVQLRRSADLPAAIARIEAINKTENLGLEVRDFHQLTPSFNQIIGMYGAIFTFIAVVIGTVVLFSVVNTMSMTVMERTNEIGTARALGFRRSRISSQFLAEGGMLGLLGATLGVGIALTLVWLINSAKLTWTPPGSTAPTPFRLLLSGSETTVLAVWLPLVLLAVIASLLPARRAARMTTVDALRHV